MNIGIIEKPGAGEVSCKIHGKYTSL
jgi:hypothetical protein